MQKLKVVIVQRVFANYRKPIFDRLSILYELKLLHSVNDSNLKQLKEEYSYPVKTTSYGKKETQVYLHIIKFLIKYKPDVIIHEFNPSIISLPITYLIAKLIGSRIVMWGHGYNRNHKKNSKIKHILRTSYLKLADAVLVYGQKSRVYMEEVGINPDKIFVATNTLDTDYLENLRNQLIKSGVLNIKKELGFNSKYNLVFIGRLLSSKHPELLIDLAEKINSSLNNTLTAHIIGNGPAYNALAERIIKNNLSEIVCLHGAIYDDSVLGKFLLNADLSVSLGEVGLSIIHSFMFHCPVAFYEPGENGPFHGPEFEHFKSGINGISAKAYDLDALATAITNYLENPVQQEKIKRGVQESILNFQITKMLKGFTDCISYCKSL